MDTINEPKKVKARKEHECDYCDKVIAIKEEHRDIAIEWWQSSKQN